MDSAAAASELSLRMQEARCFLIHAAVELKDGQFSWDVHILDQDRVRQWLPIPIRADGDFMQSWFDARVWTEWVRLHANSEKALLTGQPGYYQEFRVNRVDGGVIWISEDVRIFSVGPDRWHLTGLCADVTADHDMLDAAPSDIQNRRQVSADIRERVFLKDTESRYVSVNQNFATDLNLAVEDIIGKTDADLVAADVALNNFEIDLRVMQTRKSEATREILQKHGDQRTLVVTRCPLLTPTGKLQGVLGVKIDITEQLYTETILKDVVNSARCFLWSARVSEVADEQWNWDFDKDIRTDTPWWFPIQHVPGQDFMEAWCRARFPEDVQLMNSRSAIAFRERATGYRQEYRSRRADGGVIWVSEDVHMIQVGAKTWRVVGVCTDITQRKQVEEALRMSAERSRTLLNQLPHRIALKDRNSNIISANEQYAREWGLTAAELEGKLLADVLPIDVGRLERERDLRVITSGMPEESEDRQVVDGRLRVVRTNNTPVVDESGNVTGVLTVVTDISAQSKAEASLKDILSSARCFLWHSIVTGSNGGYSWEFDTGYESPDWFPIARRPGQKFIDAWAEAVHPDDIPEMDRQARHAFDAGWSGYSHEYRCRLVDDTIMWISEHVQIQPIGPAVFRAIGVCTDITEKKVMEFERERMLREALEHADRDPLTGLLNHRAFHKRLNEEVDRSLRNNTPFALAMIDLDNFKFFNDAYGHSVGDEVLRKTAQTLKSACREYDVLARFGGDEFALIMPEVGRDQAGALAQRLQERLRGLGYCPPDYGSVVPLSLSIGMAVFPDDGPSRQDVVDAADMRLYLMKNGASEDEVAERLRRDLVNSVDGFSMLDALVTAVDNKDRYTHRHSRGVLVFCMMLAAEIGFEPEEMRMLEAAALLHDVGKIGVPNNILRKPGRLTDEEFAAIKMHPGMGAILISSVPGLEKTLDAVRHHHERWDGRGYPSGLRATDIPLSARVMAVADAFSAMTTDRPYRKSMSNEEALRELESGAGQQWDPDCVAAFVRAYRTQIAPLPNVFGLDFPTPAFAQSAGCAY
ncbi:MAG: diguanylate cyclase domain-containing protein [Capsulimonadaceae bacterium]